MQLSAELFAQVLASLERHRAKDSEKEKRRAPRVSVQAEVTMVPCSGPDTHLPVRVRIRDFSSRGICILYRHRLAPGTQFMVRLPRRATSSMVLLCTIVHSRTVTERLVSIGAEFACILPEEALRSPPADPREADRIGRSLLA